MIIPGGQIGATIESGKEIKQYQAVNTDTLTYCWRHSLNLTSDWKNPNKRDAKRLERIKLKHYETELRDGTKEVGRFCPRCWNMVLYTQDP